MTDDIRAAAEEALHAHCSRPTRCEATLLPVGQWCDGCRLRELARALLAAEPAPPSPDPSSLVARLRDEAGRPFDDPGHALAVHKLIDEVARALGVEAHPVVAVDPQPDPREEALRVAEEALIQARAELRLLGNATDDVLRADVEVIDEALAAIRAVKAGR